MTRDQIMSIQGIAFKLADETSLFLPMIAPFVPLIEGIILAAEDAGTVPYQATPEELQAIAAGMAAARSSAVTHIKGKSNV